MQRQLLRDVMHYVRVKEQSIVYDNNRKLITNDLVAELAQCNQTYRDEMGQLLGAVQQLQMQQMGSGGGRGGAGGVKRGGKR